MSQNQDMNQYLDLFLQEADEQLETLEQETLKLESDPSDERLQAIFRAAHTLKGSSRAMGFSHFAELTHEMENVLDLLRSGQLAVTLDSADCLLSCIDTLAQMKDSISAGQGDGQVETKALVIELQRLQSGVSLVLSGKKSAVSDSPQTTSIAPDLWPTLELASEESPVFHAKIVLADDCAMKFVRVFMAINVAQQMGELLATHPAQEDLEEERFDSAFELVFHANGAIEEAEGLFKEISEIESVEVQPWQTPKPEEQTQASQDSAPKLELQVNENLVKAQAEAKPEAQQRKSETGQTIRVDVARLDALMNLVGELVIDRTRIAQVAAELSAVTTHPAIEALNETVSHIGRISTDLQDQIMKARMLPIEVVFNRLPRVVRDLAHKLDKDINLALEGGNTELDRSVIEVIGDPLLHLIRNSLDHGIELPDQREASGKPRTGTVTVKASHQENHMVIEIKDDGRGIDPNRLKAKAVETGRLTQDQADKMSDREALHLIFGSGFSTAKEVSEVSGRGVGMDIVRSNLQKLGGMIDVDSKVGEGSTFTLRLPLTLAIIRGLLVREDGNVFVLPLGSVVETLFFKEEEVQSINQKEVILLRGVTTPLVRLPHLFEGGAKASDKPGYVVIVGLAESRVGLVVQDLVGEQEVVIKSLSGFVGELKGISGATILGDGRVALIVDVSSALAA